ncbi:hypothetical protein K458DRAFT_185816 [Lentithecium fluviatile CBS 122367]|uniref:BZIP domain-containing protein n=1 Tax=Lentithecium fluviatile CBS 122367 TaxID=1168545 RepID=A0A6G1J998_9PLEO|nr:hypothetical protein K458DRAFT_185816 [Lentithecium fluviatile CBS 122367]
MSSKSRGTPASTRIRDNQRRSRAQRKEFLENLQQRVQEYERRGIAATVEVQQAAQAVARENAALRRLLARHGILREEIDRELQSANNDPLSADGPKLARLDAALRPRFPQEQTSPMTSPASVCRKPCSQVQPSYEIAERPHELPEARELVVPPPTPIVPALITTSAAETSCEAAAIIIAQMRGDGDDDFARNMLLGCQGKTDCKVKNTTLFQVLDEV